MKILFICLFFMGCQHIPVQKNNNNNPNGTPVVIGVNKKTQTSLSQNDTHDGSNLENSKHD